MITLNSPLPDEIDFNCTSQDEADFCASHSIEIFDAFIRKQTKGKFNTHAEYLRWYYEPPEFGETGIVAKWHQVKEWGLLWDISVLIKLQDMFREAYNDFVRENSSKC